MATINPSLFSWDAIEADSDINRLKLALKYLPDEEIISTLSAQRGLCGRNDFPVNAMWNTLIAGIVFQHASVESLLRELQRNPALFQACGFNPLPVQAKPLTSLVRNEETGEMKIHLPKPNTPRYAVPNSWNFSRFLFNLISLEKQHSLVSNMAITLRQQLMAELPDFGKHLGYDGKAIESHSTGCQNKSTGKTSDSEADWGSHKTTGINNKTGKLWSKVKSWFGYGLHLIADTQYESPVAFHITPASHSESVQLRKMIATLFTETPELAQRCQDFSADRGLDAGETKAMLWDNYQIRPLIDTRELWREEKTQPNYNPDEPITRALFPEVADTIVHTEKGRVMCICPKTQEVRDLAFSGFEANRNTLKYRCPAAAYNFECAGKANCHAASQTKPSDYGRVIRIKITEQNRRIFVPTPHGSPSWKRGYNRRSALERINNRIDNSFCFEKHFIRGQAKMQTRMGLALGVMMAMALGHVKENREYQMRSLVRSVSYTASG